MTTRSRPRIFLRSICLGVAAICLLPLTVTYAQKSTTVKEKGTQLARREKAVDLIVETAEAARTFKDLFYRARIQTLAADALWPHDEVRARAIFRRAWEAATAYDKSEEEAEEHESGVPSTVPITEARDEVLTKAAARDSKLAEAFLQDLLAEKSEQDNSEKSQSESQRRTPWREVSPMGQRRLALAYDLLEQNIPTRAADIAAPVIAEGESADLMAFITRLREADNSLGEAFYLRLIERTMSSNETDTNTVLLLSSQITSPWLLIVVDERGSIQLRGLGSTLTSGATLPIVSQAVQITFYNLAARILLRPIVPRAGQDMTADNIALYLAIGRLLTYFERDAPQYVSDLRMRNSTLASGIEAGRRETLNSQLGLSSISPGNDPDPLRPQIEQLGRARDAKDRDRISVGIVTNAAERRLWDRAHRAALEIEDLNVRHAALTYIAINQIADLLRAFEDDKENNFEGMAKFVRNLDVPPVASAWGLAQTAIIAKRKGDTKSADTLLNEAVMYASRTPAGTWDRVGAYTAVARMAARIDVKRAWEIMPEIVGAANALEDFAGDEDSLAIKASESDADETMEPLRVQSSVFQVDGLFEVMAQLDYEKALTSARSIGRETPRAFASLAIARVMLNSEVRG